MAGRSGVKRGRESLPEHFRPWEPGNQLARKHGAQSAVTLGPRTETIADALRRIVPGYRAADEPMVRLVSSVLARIEAADVWLNEHGLWRDEAAGELQGVLRTLSTWENTAGRLLGQLGCSPMARAALNLDVARTEEADTVTALHARALLERGGEVDGDAELDDEDGDVA
jgi:hypothetical protein